MLAFQTKLWYNSKDFARTVISRHGARTTSGLSGEQLAEDSISPYHG